MLDIQEGVQELLSALYPEKTIYYISQLAKYYWDQKAEHRDEIPIPESLRKVTRTENMSDPIVRTDGKKFDLEYLKKLGIVGDGVIIGPLNHILARMLTIPMMIKDYIYNYPEDLDELKIYEDPPMLQMPVEKLRVMYDAIFADADDALSREEVLIGKFMLLGEIGEEVAREIEPVYPARGSTQAYELFGIFHLFPSNKQVDLTATSPGVILPTEADPLEFKDTVDILKKNLLRPTYFSMLKHSVDLPGKRSRRYSASRAGTAENLKKYPQLAGAAKEILAGYLGMEDRFGIRLGDQDPKMKLATLVGDIGVVYSVRDNDQKAKIAHNVTVIDPEEAAAWRQVFEQQWQEGEPITSTDIIDELIAD